jgi:uncharacterized protein
MRLSAWMMLIWIGLAAGCQAQEECTYGGAEAAEGLEKALTEAKSCRAAVARLHACAWGSSAEGEFYSGLPTVAKKNYGEQMQRCVYAESRQDGTMYISAAALCQVDVAAKIAANHALANKPLARASFDCTKAAMPLEKAVCSDGALGRADVVLAENYSATLKTFKGSERSELIESEREWLRHVPVTCGLGVRAPFTPASLHCLRNEFEVRFTLLEGCLDGGATEDCLNPGNEDWIREQAGSDEASPRASFDCDAPKTPLELAICADRETGEKDLELATAYREARSAMGPQGSPGLAASERKWLRYVQGTCPLGAVGGVVPEMGRACVRVAFRIRIGQLKGCPQKSAGERLGCLNEFRVVDEDR